MTQFEDGFQIAGMLWAVASCCTRATTSQSRLQARKRMTALPWNSSRQTVQPQSKCRVPNESGVGVSIFTLWSFMCGCAHSGSFYGLGARGGAVGQVVVSV
jgi:hypothetical protein